MPHIVINTGVDLEKILDEFSPIVIKDKALIKITDMLLHYKKSTALFKIINVDTTTKEFFIDVSTKSSRTTIRLLPLTDPEKTDSVKSSLVVVYNFLKTFYPNASITKTNLQQYLKLNTLTC